MKEPLEILNQEITRNNAPCRDSAEHTPAAAPELLVALKGTLQWIEDSGCLSNPALAGANIERLQAARAAIAKAEGRE